MSEEQAKELIPEEDCFDIDRLPEDPQRQPKQEIRDSDILRYHDIHLPKCYECLRRWQYPREVAFLAGVPQDMRNGGSLSNFEPVTKESIVVYQTWDRHTQQPHLREEIFERLKLTHSIQAKRGIRSHLMCKGPLEYHRLVTEFDYNRKTGDVTHCSEFFDGEQEEDFRYARLITLNSWYIGLLKNILSIFVDIFSLATGFMLLGQLFGSTGGFNHVCWVRTTRLYFTYWYSGCHVLALYFSVRAAHWEWKANSSPNVGDIVIKCHKIDRGATFAALTLLIFLGVDKLVKDIVVILHPWKSVQPYAAVKIEGVRVHVVGYKSRPLFHVENSSGQKSVLLVTCAQKIISFIYKVSIILAILYQNDRFDSFLGRQTQMQNGTSAPQGCLEYQMDHSYSCERYCKNPFVSEHTGNGCSIPIQKTLIISTLVSVVSMLHAIHKVRKLLEQRHLFKAELIRILDFAEIKGDMAKQGPASKLLALHYQKEFKNGHLHSVSPSRFKKMTDESKCSTCGRDKTIPGDTPAPA